MPVPLANSRRLYQWRVGLGLADNDKPDIRDGGKLPILRHLRSVRTIKLQSRSGKSCVNH